MSGRTRSDRLNPVFLKELRQALRGRTFAVLFPATVAIAVALAITVLVDHPGQANLGPDVFLPVIVVLGVAALGLVPFSTFQSMAGEWDEGTQDLLVLSHLSPSRIVLGKLLTAAVESGLYVLAFLPLLLFTFLLTGVDVRDILFLVAGLYGASLAMSCVAMTLAGLSRVRFWRVILLVALGGLGFAALLGGIELVDQFVARGRGLGSTFASDEALALVVLVLVFGSLGFSFAATRIAHPEDDRSGPVRVTVTVLLLGFLTWLTVSPPGPLTAQVVERVAMAFGVITAMFAVFFVTEPERLPRRTATRIPAHPALAFLAAPFLPGGGRGVLWWLLQLGVLLTWAVLLPLAPSPAFTGGWSRSIADVLLHWAALMAYFVVYLAGFSLAMTRLRERSSGPLAARLILPSVAILSMVLPIMIGFLLDQQKWRNGDHALMPFWAATAGEAQGVRLVAILVAAVVLLANGPRMMRSFREVLAASRARRVGAVKRSEVSAHAA
ncbi:MAG: hypothetical protein NTY35_14495 [Planctomycetota bacterium]|nr:hypothetical protein [Planctomycetota bacterium]